MSITNISVSSTIFNPSEHEVKTVHDILGSIAPISYQISFGEKWIIPHSGVYLPSSVFIDIEFASEEDFLLFKLALGELKNSMLVREITYNRFE